MNRFVHVLIKQAVSGCAGALTPRCTAKIADHNLTRTLLTTDTDKRTDLEPSVPHWHVDPLLQLARRPLLFIRVVEWPQEAPNLPAVGMHRSRLPAGILSKLPTTQLVCMLTRSCCNRTAETPEQRQKRKQAEQARADAQVLLLRVYSCWCTVFSSVLCQFQAAQEAQAKAEAEQNQNYLKRETPFLCNVRFRCDLPEVGMKLRCTTIAHSASDSPVTPVTLLHRQPFMPTYAASQPQFCTLHHHLCGRYRVSQDADMLRNPLASCVLTYLHLHKPLTVSHTPVLFSTCLFSIPVASVSDAACTSLHM